MNFQQKKSVYDVLKTELEQHGTCLDQIVAFYNHQEHYPAVPFQVPLDMDFLPELNNGICKPLIAELIVRHIRTIILRKRQRN
jgi:hypothetical protein